MDPKSDSSGRVTRALRKQLKSGDSDDSSRPQTPIQTKVSTAATNSPLRTRITRRNSVSGVATPVKTPGKRAASFASVSTRTTRRRSISLEIEESPKIVVKTSHFESLVEETQLPGPTTPSKSKSPNHDPIPKRIDRKSSTIEQFKQEAKVDKDKDILSCDTNKNDKDMKDFNNKENNIDILNSPIQNRNTTITKEKPRDLSEHVKSLPNNSVANKLESPQERKSLSITKDEEEDIAIELDGKKKLPLPPLEGNLLPNDVSVGKEKSFKEDEATEDANRQSPGPGILNNELLVEDTPDAEDAAGSIKIKEEVHSLEVQETLLMKNNDISTSECKDETEMHSGNQNAKQIAEELCEEETRASLTLNEENNEHDEPVFVVNKTTEVSSGDDVDDMNREMGTTNVKSPDSPEASSRKSLKFNSSDTTTPARISSHLKSDDMNEFKTVAFATTNVNEEEEKSIYPKTPSSVKNKSIAINQTIEKSFVAADCSINESIVSVHDTTDVETSPQSTAGIISKDDTFVSTAVENAFKEEGQLKDSNMSIVENLKQNDTDKLCDTNDDEPGITLRWCSPKLIGNSSKLDTIKESVAPITQSHEPNTTSAESNNDNQFDTIEEFAAAFDAFTPLVKRNSKSAKRNDGSQNESLHADAEKEDEEKADENEDDDNQDDENEDDENEGEEEKESENKSKHPFINEKAMVVHDYISGDSMESEELLDMQLEEISEFGESLGSDTPDEDDEMDEQYERDSFIVSDDSADVDNVSGSSECDKKKKQRYNRLEEFTSESSRDEDDEPSEANKSIKIKLSQNEDSETEDEDRKSANKMLSKKKSLQLQCSSEDEADISSGKVAASEQHVSPVEYISKTEEIERNSNKSNNSSRLSDSALQLQLNNSEDFSVEGVMNISRKEILRQLNQSDRFNKSVRDINTDLDVSPEAVKDKPTSMSGHVGESDLYDTKNVAKESHAVGEVSEIAEDKGNQEYACNDGDTDEEDQNIVAELETETKQARGLSASFGNYIAQKQEKNKLPKYKVLQRSFTIGVFVDDGKIETEILKKDTTAVDPVTVSTSPLASLSSNDSTDGGEVLSSGDARYLENMKQMPLGNPLVRTRRQSLTLPTNPDMEIGSRRRSFTPLSHNDFNPSQSCVDSVDLQKVELECQTLKRKRLSKSFSGMSADTSVAELDVRHLHKRSKLSLENSSAESVANLQQDNSMTLKMGHSSTPHEKGSTKQLNNSGLKRILDRCDDELLEAANRAKLMAKLSVKSKNRLPKKNKKLLKKQTAAKGQIEKAFAPITNKIKKRDKVKIAVTQNIPHTSNQMMAKNQLKMAAEPCRMHPELQNNLKENLIIYRDHFTTAGNVFEMPQSPKRKKPMEIIHLPTGPMCVELLSPPKRTIISCNGIEFVESPLSPSAFGFKVRKLNAQNDNKGERKRKRHIGNGRNHPLSILTCTKSGIFIEEEI